MTAPVHRNRLADALSPYLRQHGHNPVDWYPWGPEAHAKARAEDRPILLSIGYSACHWCHVMERESFDDPEVAAVMNGRFVNVKVDREERPDLDQIYQLVVQLGGRSGGWPLTVFLLPDLQPFFGGTYFPPAPRYGMPSFRQVLDAVHEAFTARRDEIGRAAGDFTDAIREITTKAKDPADPPRDAIPIAAGRLARSFDEDHGGFGGAPKFPNAMALDVLLRASRRGDGDALARFDKALVGMREGGVYDQLGGGFHRYSVDERWAVPHFEKMLYDNALLTRAYVDGWRATGSPDHAATVAATLAYLEREMRSPEGAFYSTQDADSEGEEGRFFVWSVDEVEAVLGAHDAPPALLWFGVAPGGNFEDGRTVLSRRRTLAELAGRFGASPSVLAERLEDARRRLFEAREARPRPFRDEKILASWNGLAIGAFAEAGAAFGEGRWVRTAREGLDFLRSRMTRPDGGLARLSMGGEVSGHGFLEDHGDVASAALDVYEASFDEAALAYARGLTDVALDRFWDDAAGGFFFAPEGADDLVVRAKDQHDQAVPSGSASMAQVLLRLHAMTGEARYLDRAEATIRAVAAQALGTPLAFGHLLGAIDRYLEGPTDVVIVAAVDDPDGDALARVVRRTYLPCRVLRRVAPDAADGPATAVLGGKRQIDGRATAYVCRDRVCSPPVTDPGALARSLR